MLQYSVLINQLKKSMPTPLLQFIYVTPICQTFRCRTPMLQHPHNHRIERFSEFKSYVAGDVASAHSAIDERRLDRFHIRGRRTYVASFDYPCNIMPVLWCNIAYRDVRVWLKIAVNMGVKCLCFDVLTSWLHLAKVQKRNKSNLEALPGSVYPLESFLNELRLWLLIHSAEFLSVANCVFVLTSAIKYSSQTLTIPVTVRPWRTVARRWQDHWRLWKSLLKQALLVTISRRHVLSFRSLCMGVDEARYTLMFVVVFHWTCYSRDHQEQICHAEDTISFSLSL